MVSKVKNMSYHLKVSFDPKKAEVVISGDEQGLQYLSEICKKIIGKTTPAGHYHLSPEMGNADAESIPTTIAFVADR